MSPRVPLRGACRAAGMSNDFRWLSATCEAQTTNVKRGLRSRCEETRDPARLSQHVPPDTGHTFCKKHHVAVQCVSSRYPHLMSSHLISSRHQRVVAVGMRSLWELPVDVDSKNFQEGITTPSYSVFLPSLRCLLTFVKARPCLAFFFPPGAGAPYPQALKRTYFAGGGVEILGVTCLGLMVYGEAGWRWWWPGVLVTDMGRSSHLPQCCIFILSLVLLPLVYCLLSFSNHSDSAF